MCFFTWLICLTAVSISVVTYHLKKDGGNAVGCAPDGNHWLFADCGARFFIQFLHVFTTMQCAAMARVVFVKTVKKLRTQHEGFMGIQSPRGVEMTAINDQLLDD